MKSEPDAFSLSDLKKMDTEHWDGIRNYQARNNMQEMKVGDGILFYHSNAKPNAVVGTAVVVKESYEDFTAFDAKQKYYDPKSDPENPKWFMVDIQYKTTLSTPVTLKEIKANPALSNMALVKNSRLSVSPVSKQEWQEVLSMGK